MVVVAAVLVVEVGVRVVDRLEEGVEKVEEGVLVYRSVNMVVIVIKGVAAVILN